MRPTLTSPLARLVLVLAAPAFLHADVSLTVTVGPPPIPVYEQPVCPSDGYAWTPGYWAWGTEGYFWVPGTWVSVPAAGLLWTPGYWGWGGNGFLFNAGYWGTHVGFYGGVNYGYGYGGSGFQGGYWQGRNYYYNRSVTNVNTSRITNVYTRPVTVNPSRVAFNGGSGGLRAAPTAKDRSFAKENRVPPTAEQAQHHESAGQNKNLLASVNHGRPPIAATTRPGDFTTGNATAAKAANEPRNTRGTARQPPAAPEKAVPHASAQPARQHPAAQPPETPMRTPTRNPREARPSREAPAPREARAPREAQAPRPPQTPRREPEPGRTPVPNHPEHVPMPPAAHTAPPPPPRPAPPHEREEHPK